jgi:hypothetical protein
VSSRLFFVLALLGGVVLVAVQAAWLRYPPNLLANPGFEKNLSGWQVEDNGGGTRTDTPASGLMLALPGRDETAWVAVTQQLPVSPGQPYTLAADYRLSDQAGSAAHVILRVEQFDQAGQLLGQIETSGPPGPAPGAGGQDRAPQWIRLTQPFVTDDRAASARVRIALYGEGAASAEIGHVVFGRTSASRLVLVRGSAGVLAEYLIAVGMLGCILHATRFQSALKRVDAKRAVLWLLKVAVSVILFCTLTELLSLGLYFVRTGRLFYPDRRQRGQVEESANVTLTDTVLHPVLGFTLRPGTATGLVKDGRRIVANNYGFASDHDYPFLKSSQNQYVIGVFGGSVSQLFTIQGGERLVEDLKRDRFFRDKDILLLSFGNGAYKQPQQVQTLAYFLSIGQEFDMVINIDGFNEVALSNVNYRDGVDISMPSTTQLAPIRDLIDQRSMTPEKIASLARIMGYKVQLHDLARQMNEAWLASEYLVLEAYFNYVYAEYGQERLDFQYLKSDPARTSLIYINPGKTGLGSSTDVFEKVAQNWVTSSVLMHQILKARNVPYFHFLQPNQYFSKKPFNKQEARLALDDNSTYKPGVEAGYPVLVARSAILEQSGVHFFNAVNIFDEEPATVYSDTCCHYNQRGNDLLADFVAHSILSSGEF